MMATSLRPDNFEHDAFTSELCTPDFRAHICTQVLFCLLHVIIIIFFFLEKIRAIPNTDDCYILRLLAPTIHSLPLGVSSTGIFLKSSAKGRKMTWKPGGVSCTLCSSCSSSYTVNTAEVIDMKTMVFYSPNNFE